MTFDQIVSDVMDRLNLTSQDARDRVGKRLNDRYKQVTSAINLITSRRIDSTITVDPTDPDSILPDLVVEGMEKIVRIKYLTRTLECKSYDDVTRRDSSTGQTRAYAIKRMGAGEVTITLDRWPDASFFLKIEGYELADELADDAEPAFPSDFHNVLIEGVMADELRKMEKPQLAQIADNKFTERLSALRMFIAVEGYNDLIPGKNQRRRYWLR